jgi:hypothetical protein
MNNKVFAACVIVLGALFSLDSYSQSLVVQPRLTAGVEDYTLTFGDVTAGTGNAILFRDGLRISDQLKFSGAGVTTSYGRAFLDLSAQATNTGSTDGEQFEGTTGSPNPGAFPTAYGFEHLLHSTFNRNEFDAALGWGFSPTFSAYVGFKHARLHLPETIEPDPTYLPNNGDLLFFGSRDLEFTYNGPFLGATASLPVRSWGAFSIQASVARLDATFLQSFSGDVFEVVPNPFAPGTSTLAPVNPAFANKAPNTGRSTGLNLGLSWSGSFAWLRPGLERLSYTIGIDRSEYQFSSNQTQQGDFEETISRLRLDLRYRFGGWVD